MTTVRDAVQAAAKADGSKVIYEQPADSNGATQIPFVQDLISKKVDVIAISGSDTNSTKAALAQAKAAGIKVIAFDSDVAPEERSLFVNQVDTNAIGEALLEEHVEPDGRLRRVRDRVVDPDGDEPERLDRHHQGQARQRSRHSPR